MNNPIQNHKTQSDRWSSPSEYSRSWSERNQKLLELYDAQCPNALITSFTEYGCGPHAPFRTTVRKDSGREVILADRVSWNDSCHVVDLNALESAVFLNSDTAVFSGVLEYIDNVELLLSHAQKHHRYLLISYAVRKHVSGSSTLVQLADEVQERASKHGWRNHYHFDDLLTILGNTAIVGGIDQWREQVLLFAIFR